MKKKYIKKTRRSRRKKPEELKGKILGKDEAAVQLSLPIAEIVAGVEDSVEALAVQAGLLIMRSLIDDEVQLKAGERYSRGEERQAP